MKVCSKCATEKPLSFFFIDRSRKSGRRSECKDCGNYVAHPRTPYTDIEAKAAHKESHKRYRQTDKGRKARILAMQRYRNTDRGRVKTWEGNLLRRTREYNAPGYATTEQILARWAYYGGNCYLCGKPADSIEHVIPLSRGGTNWASNLRPACLPCNHKKWATPLKELQNA